MCKLCSASLGCLYYPLVLLFNPSLVMSKIDFLTEESSSNVFVKPVFARFYSWFWSTCASLSSIVLVYIERSDSYLIEIDCLQKWSIMYLKVCKR